MKNRSLKLIIICALAFVYSQTNAAVVTWSGSGSFTQIGYNLSGIRSVGDSVQITASYDTSAIATGSYFGRENPYAWATYSSGANVHMRFTSGDLVWEGRQNAFPSSHTAEVSYTPPAGDLIGDLFYLRLRQEDGSLTGIGAVGISLFITSGDGDENFISGFNLPSPSQVDLSRMTVFVGFIDYSSNYSNPPTTMFNIDLGTVTIVPEPSTGLLVVLGLSGLLLKKRRMDRPLPHSSC